jgi:hypothetical protein
MKSSSPIGLAFGIAALACGTALATTPADPCQSAGVAKHSVPISVTVTEVAGNTVLIPASGQSIHVCGFLVQGAPFSFLYGGGVACSASPVPLTGSPLYGWTTAIVYSGPGTVFSVPANNALCLFTDCPGTTCGYQGVLTYTRP